MGYYYTAEPENAVPPKSWATPKTHVPGSPVKERGYRFYSPENGRWCSRDPLKNIGTTAWNNERIVGIARRALAAVMIRQYGVCHSREIGQYLDGYSNDALLRLLWLNNPAMFERRFDPNSYAFVLNRPGEYVDILGLIPSCPPKKCDLDRSGGGGVSSGWCRDVTYPHVVDGTPLSCYRSLGGLSGQQCCYDSNGNLAPGETGTSPDVISPASSADSQGNCRFRNPFIYLGHVILDWFPSQFPNDTTFYPVVF